MYNFSVWERLPAEHSRQIGRIITRWAYLEWHLRQIVYQLLPVDPKAGRLVVREPRVTDAVTMISDLAEMRGVHLQKDFKKLNTELQRLVTHRDRIAHGIWLKNRDNKIPILQVTKGSWQPDPNNPPIKRVIKPEGIPLSIKDLRVLVDQIEIAISKIMLYRVAVARILAKPPTKSL